MNSHRLPVCCSQQNELFACCCFSVGCQGVALYSIPVSNRMSAHARGSTLHSNLHYSTAGVASGDALWRVLRLAEAQGVLAAQTNRAGITRFRNNALSATLRASHPASVR